jgi:hypothetical protein
MREQITKLNNTNLHEIAQYRDYDAVDGIDGQLTLKKHVIGPYSDDEIWLIRKQGKIKHIVVPAYQYFRWPDDIVLTMSELKNVLCAFRS